jgi:hypothetical protein
MTNARVPAAGLGRQSVLRRWRPDRSGAQRYLVPAADLLAVATALLITGAYRTPAALAAGGLAVLTVSAAPWPGR